MKSYFVYILSNWNNKVLYIGVTNNLERRIWEHKNHIISGFTEKYNVEKLVYFEETSDIESAILREKQLKNWRRDKKVFLIEKANPDWKDLSEQWYKDPSTTLGMTAEGIGMTEREIGMTERGIGMTNENVK